MEQTTRKTALFVAENVDATPSGILISDIMDAVAEFYSKEPAIEAN